MPLADLKERIDWLFPGSKRVLAYRCDEGIYVRLDLHFLSVKKALQATRNVIAICRGTPFTLEVIHGYIHGTGIRDAIRRLPISPRVIAAYPCWNNPGATILKVSGGLYEQLSA